MEWMNKGERPAAPATLPTAPSRSSKQRFKTSNGLGIATAVLLFSATLVFVLVLLWTTLTGNGSENRYVDNKKLQAVFLNGGQVYFGNIQNLNDKLIRMRNIYYLRVNQTVQPDSAAAANNNQNISLVKLGCELHGPTDQMLINREQVIFWENLKSDGQVAKAVADYVKQNPNGQNCSQANQPTSGSSSTPTTGAAPAPTTTAPSTGTATPTKKP
ncbi:MAG: hypothetical protein NVS1B7_1050 [Candidatus Saccharimonadales bacterium]